MKTKIPHEHTICFLGRFYAPNSIFIFTAAKISNLHLNGLYATDDTKTIIHV